MQLIFQGGKTEPIRHEDEKDTNNYEDIVWGMICFGQLRIQKNMIVLAALTPKNELRL